MPGLKRAIVLSRTAEIARWPANARVIHTIVGGITDVFKTMSGDPSAYEPLSRELLAEIPQFFSTYHLWTELPAAVKTYLLNEHREEITGRFLHMFRLLNKCNLNTIRRVTPTHMQELLASAEQLIFELKEEQFETALKRTL